MRELLKDSCSVVLETDTVSIYIVRTQMNIGAGALYVLAAINTQEVRREAQDACYRENQWLRPRSRSWWGDQDEAALQKSRSASRALASSNWLWLIAPPAGPEQSKHNGRWGKILDGLWVALKLMLLLMKSCMASDMHSWQSNANFRASCREGCSSFATDLDEFERRLTCIWQTFSAMSLR